MCRIRSARRRRVGSGKPGYFFEGSIFLNGYFLFDQLTVAMFIPVLYISTLIHIYSIDYLSSDPLIVLEKHYIFGDQNYQTPGTP